MLADEYVHGIASLPIEELRARRAECQALEVSLSYQRRMAQGRLDIVAAEQARRAGGEDALAEGELVDQLRDILADRIHAPGNGRLPQLMTPEASDVDTTELDAIVGPRLLGSLDELAAADLDGLVERLSGYESGVSEQRHRLHQRIDALQAEITRRYRTGQASVESLLR